MCGLWPRSGVRERDAPSGVVSAPCAGRRAAHGVAESLLDFACWYASHVVPISRCHSTFEQIPESREISTERAFSINPPRHVLSRFVDLRHSATVVGVGVAR